MKKGIYAIYDLSAESIVGGLHLFANDASAVRFFGDVALDTQTFVSRHIEDHELRELGILDEMQCDIVSDSRVVVTGSAWKAAQIPTEVK